MIASFRNRALRRYWTRGDASKIAPALVERVRRRRLGQLEYAEKPDDMNVPGFNFHKLRGSPTRYTVHVNGPWCITFGWSGDSAIDVDLEDYH